MEIQTNVSLKPYHTFGIEVKAKEFCEVSVVAELKEALRYAEVEQYPYFILGGGSNVLFTQDYDGLVIRVNTKGKEKVSEDSTTVLWRVQAGENWHDFVMWTLDQGYYGLENLALIPGTVGAAPIQNIGAYGVEVKDVVETVEVLDVDTFDIKDIPHDACAFGYRDSIFKRQKGKYIVLAVTFRLQKNAGTLVMDYGAVKAALAQMKVDAPTAEDVAQAVINIRQSKLPDPATLGNSGSFFKNPVVDFAVFETIQKTYPDVPHYKLNNTDVKIPAGWLIEQAGFKGKRFGDAGVHDMQALVLVNHGKASGQELFDLAQNIRQKVKVDFGIDLAFEVNIL
ncbi:MAG: UDP-N-acetylenolpyruvoylglucosamine reductase [Flavobacteriales bacterium]|nr:MAG: UDP-N-acetylenolpyruvoylglucosamine reductase [Flavobacteriales bacterium]